MSLFRFAMAASALPLLATPAFAQTQTPTQFVAEFTAAAPGEEQVLERGDAVLAISMRPELAVELTAVPDAASQRAIGVARDAPLTVGTRLYGSSNRRSLFCHIVNDRIAGSTGTCFRDFDNDGAFEQGVKLEAPSLNTDVVILNQSGEWHGGTFRDRERLRPAITYRPVPANEVQTWPARVTWAASVNKVDPEDYPVTLTFGIMEDEAGNGSDVIGQCYVNTIYAGSPVSVDFYGNRIDILGFTEDGNMRAVVTPNPAPQTVGLIYRFESRNAYVGMALAHNQRVLACSDPAAGGPID